jgi:HAD superfamily 5'-nucleotidase-like hydrolase
MSAPKTSATPSRPSTSEVSVPTLSRERGIFCNRTLNLRAIKAIGYDMDYTLIHYRSEQWELRAYEYVRQKLVQQNWPVDDLQFEPDRVVRGLIIDLELGNIVKANRFGYVKQALHGTSPLDFETQRERYSRTIVDLSEERYEFINTMFSLSEACLYTQLVDRLDAGNLPKGLTYRDLYLIVRNAIDETHVEGLLKAEIIADPDRFVELDPELPITLLDQKHAGKKLLLITNSEWGYTRAMMEYAFDRFLPEGTWRDLFDIIIVSARKPEFFSTRSPLFKVVDEQGLLEPSTRGFEKKHHIYLGGHAGAVEEHLGVSGDQILYVGDHIFADVHVTKSILRWRTALIVREIEEDLRAIERFQPEQERLSALMRDKEGLELAHSQLRLQLQRRRARYGPQPIKPVRELERELTKVRNRIAAIDEKASVLAVAAGQLGNSRWGQLMRAGNDKSHLARQVERHADVYLSRVSNFLYHTPFFYFRPHRGSLPHDS